MDAIQFIRAFAPIISKAAMQTYLSALPLASSTSPLLFGKYSTMSRPSIEVLEPRNSDHRVIHNPVEALPSISGTVLDARNIAISPDGQWIAIENKDQRALDIWNVETLTCAKTIATGNFHLITYSADGKKVMTVASTADLNRLVLIWDVETNQVVLESVIPHITDRMGVAISPDGSQAAASRQNSNVYLGIDIQTGSRIVKEIRPFDMEYVFMKRLVWSPNGESLAMVNSVETSGFIFDNAML
jgi:DNA-binding beta-propeller fold protein YncE